MWNAADAHAQGSGAALERWATAELQKAVATGQLDPNNGIAMRSFLASLGITPEKGGGKALYDKFMGPGGAVALAKTRQAAAGQNAGQASGRGSYPGGVPGSGSASGYGGVPPAGSGRASSYSGGYPSADDMSRRNLADRYGSNSTLGSIGGVPPNYNPPAQYKQYDDDGYDDGYGGY